MKLVNIPSKIQNVPEELGHWQKGISSLVKFEFNQRPLCFDRQSWLKYLSSHVHLLLRSLSCIRKTANSLSMWSNYPNSIREILAMFQNSIQEILAMSPIFFSILAKFSSIKYQLTSTANHTKYGLIYCAS